MSVHLSPAGSRPIAAGSGPVAAASRRVAAVALAGTSLVAAAAVGSIFLSTARDAWTAVAATGPAGPADGILLMAGLGGTLLSLWLGLGTALSALSALPGALGHVSRQLAGRVAPAAVRKVVAFVLGTTLTAALVPGTAVAGIGPEALRGAVVTTAQQATYARSGLAVAAPDASFRFVSGRPPVTDVNDFSDVNNVNSVTDVNGVSDAAPPPAWSLERTSLERAQLERTERPGERVVVHRGDTLWSISARHLGPAATAADIDAEWHRWLAVNREVIGDDANLIFPGQLLRPPPSPRAGS